MKNVLKFHSVFLIDEIGYILFYLTQAMAKGSFCLIFHSLYRVVG